MYKKSTFVKTLLIGVLFFALQFGFSQRLLKATEDVYLFGQGAYSLIVLTDDGVVVVDTLNAMNAQALDDAIKGLTDLPVKYVFYSHNHWDHISGAQLFKDQGATIISHIDAKTYLKPNPGAPPADLTWSGDFSSMKIGNKTLELHHFGASHGKGMTVFTIPEDSAMFTVDLVVADRVGFMGLPDFDMDGWISTLDEMLLLDYEIGLFGHDAGSTPPIGTKDNVFAQRQFLLDLTEAVQTAMQSGDFGAAMNPDLPQYSDWAGYDDWLGMNAATVMLQTMMGYGIY